MNKVKTMPVQSVATSFQVVHRLLEKDGARLSELSEELEIPLSTLHDHLNTLEQLDYVVKKDQRYYPGIKFLEIGGQVRSNYKIYQVAKDEIDQLAEDTGDHANLMVEEHGIGTLIYKVEGDNAIRLDTYIGMQIQLHAVSMGKSILAYLPRSRVEEIVEMRGLPPKTQNTITDVEVLMDELEEIRKTGYAMDSEERIEGVSCIAAPILDNNKRPLGAISVSAPTQKIQAQMDVEQIQKRVQRTANTIEVNINFS